MLLRFLIPGALLAALVPAAVAQQADDPVVRQLVAKMGPPARTLQDSGFALVEGVALLGTLPARSYEDKTMRLEAGRQYIIVGVCNDDCGDMDLTASDGSGREIASDTEDDAMPVLAIVPEQTGDYTFRVQIYECSVEPCAYFVQPFMRGGAARQGGGQPSRGGLGAASGNNAGGARVEQGRLETSDRQLSSGEYFDRYTFQGRQGQQVVLELRSNEFDTFLGLLNPAGTSAEQNDDVEQGNTTLSRITHTLSADGEWTVVVTSYAARETGSYELRITGAGGPPARSNKGNNEAAPTQGDVRTERGRLEQGDQTLSGGEYRDTYTLSGRAGQRVVFDLQSTDFDTYVFVRGPNDFAEDNDDYEGSTQRSRIETTLPADGAYRVTATSYQSGESGAYVLTITTGGSGGVVASTAGSSRAEDGSRIERGGLAQGDETLSAGEFIDVYTIEGRRGQEIVLDLQSGEFDPYLIFRGPDEFSEDNDDFEGSTNRSVIRATLPVDGTYRVGVTSYAADETGSYVLRITEGSGASGQVAQSANLNERGVLSSADDTLSSGEFADAYTFTGSVGQPVTVDVQASGFDPYVMLVSPGNEQEENDDWEGSTSHSRVETTLQESGTYRVIVTSYATGETGDYEVAVEFGNAVAASEQRDVARIASGEPARGVLEDGDGQLDNGALRDVFVFEAQAGQQVTVDMRSSVFDTYLGLIMPNGETVQNDDFEGSTQHSQVTLAVPEAGRYRIVATSYAAGQAGAYELSLRLGAAGQVARNTPGPAAPAGAPRIFGVFAGISQYGGRANDLPYTADDAVRVYNAMQQGPGMPAGNGVLLTDADATAANLRGAVERFAAQMGPNDMLVFFYSGHGGRQPRVGGFQASDPDDLDETLEFYDRGVTDDEFSEWLDMVTNGRVLLVLDACFSGGFSKDVISRPNRMGMFSSEEDVTSSVAAKFRAGGYLAVFLADGIESGLADSDGDGSINALELSQYVHDRYREDVKSSDPGDFVRTGGPQLSYQHLVVDRGSVGPYEVLFR